jgi:rieske iron-sulfur protein
VRVREASPSGLPWDGLAMTACPDTENSISGGETSATKRRTLLAAGAGVSLGLMTGQSGAQSDATRLRPQEGDLLVRADSTDMSPLTPQALPINGAPLLAVPYDRAAKLLRDGSRLNRILLLHLDPTTLNEQTAARAAEGVVAYSAVCPHTGCEVILWHPAEQILECPCHNTKYDPKAGARVVSGPSPRGLAALPLQIADGNLVVTHPFIGRLGIQQT